MMSQAWLKRRIFNQALNCPRLTDVERRQTGKRHSRQRRYARNTPYRTELQQSTRVAIHKLATNWLQSEYVERRLSQGPPYTQDAGAGRSVEGARTTFRTCCWSINSSPLMVTLRSRTFCPTVLVFNMLCYCVSPSP